ncbi:MAG: hypothetical protein ACREBC_38430 [Pyrinomonadaceae bacterium]
MNEDEEGQQYNDRESQEMDIWDALDHALAAGAALDDLRLLAWASGTNWTPKKGVSDGQIRK